jgi:hypothetical protein
MNLRQCANPRRIGDLMEQHSFLDSLQHPSMHYLVHYLRYLLQDFLQHFSRITGFFAKPDFRPQPGPF